MRNIPVFLLTLYFFTFLIGNYQGAYDRIAPQFVFISIINLVSLGYLFYLKTLHEILINIKKSNILLSYTAYLFIAISIGLGFGANQAIITILAFLINLDVIALKDIKHCIFSLGWLAQLVEHLVYTEIKFLKFVFNCAIN